MGMLSPALRPMPVTPTALRWPPPGSDQSPAAKPAMCLLCKGSYERELAKLEAEQTDKPASRPEAAKPGLPHWLQLSNDQNKVCVFPMSKSWVNIKLSSTGMAINIWCFLFLYYRPRSKS